MKKRLLSTMLALCLALTMLPLNALATDEPPVETETGAELQEEEATTPENPTPLTPIEVTEDEQTTTPDSGGTSELGNPSEDATNSQLSGSDSGNEQDEPMILSETKESARTSITDPGLTASGTCGDNATWTLNTYTGILTISGSGRMTKGQWSAYETIVKTIVIQDGITSIGEWAFHGFKNLTDVTIPNSVTTIEMGAFADCSSIDNITIPNSVVNIEHSAFRACVSLHNVDIPNSVTNLGMQAFSSCRNLTSVTIPGSINTIKSSTFYSCESLMDVLISDGVETIEDMAFGYCGFESIHIPNSVTRIKGHAFGFCRNLKSIILPNSVTNIENDNGGAFWTCSGLISVVLPENLPELCIGLFAGCDHLTNVYIPKAAKNIRTSAFVDCDGLTDIYYEGNEEDWKAITIGLNNESLEKATIHYNSKPEDVPMPRDFRVYRNGGYETFDVSLEECKSRTNSTQYNPQLAHMLIAMCNSVYSENDINRTFDSFGFGNDKDRMTDYSMNGILLSYGMAKKQVKDKSGKEKTLVLVVARGTEKIISMEDASNIFDSGANGDNQHSGFADASGELYRRMVSDEFLGTTDFTNVEFVLTGFSRGAAVANILAARLVNETGSMNNIHAYTFACPDTIKDRSDLVKEKYSCIFNIANINDGVSWLKGGSWSKYGNSFWYGENFEDYDNLQIGMSAHNQATYMDFLRAEKGSSGYVERDDAALILCKAQLIRYVPKSLRGVLSIFACPVDLKIYDSDGQLLGSVINNVADVALTDRVYISAFDDKKCIFLPNTEAYTIELTGTDSGALTYTIQNVNTDTWEASEEKIFANVALTNGKSMISYINPSTNPEIGMDVPNTQLLVLGNDGKPEKEVLPDGNGTEVYLLHTITFDANGGTVNPTTMMTGTNGKLPSLPTATRNNYKFNGWFFVKNGGAQITTDTIFTEDTTVYAQWKNNISSDTNSNNGNNTSSGNGNSVNNNSFSSSVANGRTSEPIATADSGNSEEQTATTSPTTGDTLLIIWPCLVSILIIAILTCIFIKKRRKIS